MESVNFSVMINGKPRGKLLFLFTLVSDVLSRILERAQEANLIHGLVSRHDHVEVSHLQGRVLVKFARVVEVVLCCFTG